MPEMGTGQFPLVKTDKLYLDQANIDILVERVAANMLGLAVGDSLAVDEIYLDRTNRDVKLARSAADKLDLPDGLVLGGDLELGANKLRTTNLLIKEVDSTRIGLKNAADNAYQYWFAAGFRCQLNGGAFDAQDAADAYALFRAKTTATTLTEVARLAGGVTPQFQAGVAGNAMKASSAAIAFYGTTPIAQQTGVAVTAAAIHAALVALGLITA